MTKDFAERHVERWRDHWIDVEFDDDVELLTMRLEQVRRYLSGSTRRAMTDLALQESDYVTLHQLMIRDTPGRASPGDLARDLGVSNAGMTGRLDVLEKRGWVKRTPGVDDRRRVDVEATSAGVGVWRQAMALRGQAENELATALTPSELRTLNRLLKKLTLWAEGADPAGS